MTRQIVLDTETTGLDPKGGHRLIEIGCVELVNRKLTGNNFHKYINPEREVDPGAFKVHGISSSFLADKPVFADIVTEFLEYIKGAELIIHNAPFDVGFINAELERYKLGWANIEAHCQITDSLLMARKAHPGQKNNLDALCSRYDINNSSRTLHGALLDAEILAEVYLAMTGGQMSLSLELGQENITNMVEPIRKANATVEYDLPVIKATQVELQEHENYLKNICSDDVTDRWS